MRFGMLHIRQLRLLSLLLRTLKYRLYLKNFSHDIELNEFDRYLNGKKTFEYK